MLTKELEDVGIRLNKQRPNISVTRTKTGGLKYNSTVPGGATTLSHEMCHSILQQYKLFNVDVVIREDASIDDFIDVLEESGTSPRVYMKCVYVYNKIDMLSIPMVDALARQPFTQVISVRQKLNLDGLLDRIWQELALVRVYTKKKGMFPDFTDPLVMTPQRGNKSLTVENAVGMLHKSILDEFKSALVWGTSVRSSPQACGKAHELHDEAIAEYEQVGGMVGEAVGGGVAGATRRGGRRIGRRRSTSLMESYASKTAPSSSVSVAILTTTLPSGS